MSENDSITIGACAFCFSRSERLADTALGPACDNCLAEGRRQMQTYFKRRVPERLPNSESDGRSDGQSDGR